MSISTETLMQAREEAETGNDQYSRGFVSTVITELLQARKELEAAKASGQPDECAYCGNSIAVSNGKYHSNRHCPAHKGFCEPIRERVAMAILDKLVKMQTPLDMGKDINTLADAAIAAMAPKRESGDVEIAGVKCKAVDPKAFEHLGCKECGCSISFHAPSCSQNPPSNGAKAPSSLGGWQPIETAPFTYIDGDSVEECRDVITCDARTGEMQFGGKLYKNHKNGIIGYFATPMRPTHWMPFPKPPEMLK